MPAKNRRKAFRLESMSLQNEAAFNPADSRAYLNFVLQSFALPNKFWEIDAKNCRRITEPRRARAVPGGPAFRHREPVSDSVHWKTRMKLPPPSFCPYALQHKVYESMNTLKSETNRKESR